MRIAMAQMEVIPGRPDLNLETMLRMIEEAKKQKVDLIGFSELCVSGYLISDRWNVDSICKYFMEFNERLLEASKGIAIAYGNIFLDTDIQKRVGKGWHPNKDGRTRKYNAVYVIQNGKPAPRAKETKLLPKGVQPKTLLPTYRFFDDERYFYSLQDIADEFSTTLEELAQPFLIEVDGKMVPIGVELCEDLWCEDYRRDREPVNVTKHLIKNGATKILNLSASPWTYGKNAARDRRVAFLKKQTPRFVPFLYINCVGAQNNGKNIVTFDGGSTVYNRDGKPIIFSKEAYREELMIVDERDYGLSPIKRPESSRIGQKIEAAIEGVRHLKHLSGKYTPDIRKLPGPLITTAADSRPRNLKKFCQYRWQSKEDTIRGQAGMPLLVTGLSGGIDSATAIAIEQLAAGPKNVLAVGMPTPHNSAKTRSAAKKTAKNLGIKFIEVPIQGVVDANRDALIDALTKIDGREIGSVTEENIQAKIRGTSILSNICGIYGGLMSNNGNKLETGFNYATLYGDVNGAVAILADFLKTEVYDAARFMNSEIFKREAIPSTMILGKYYMPEKKKIFPSAELKQKQRDPMKFGYHDALLYGFMDYKRKSVEEFMQMYRDGTLHKYVAQVNGKPESWGAKLMKLHDLTTPQVFIDDMGWVQKQLSITFKRNQSPLIIVTSKSSFGYDERESILPPIITFEQMRLQERIKKMRQYKR
jgi:NAD+ synthase (glutamine-hydrolysing)